MNLQEWFGANLPDDKMLWKKSFERQIIFVRDYIASLISRNYKEATTIVKVVNTHTSKSIVCPVYYIEQIGVKIWMRYNFYDWNVSIDARATGQDVDCDFVDCFSDKDYGYCFCQGMEEQKFLPYNDDKRRFTVCIGNDYDLYVFFRVLRKHLKIIRGDEC